MIFVSLLLGAAWTPVASGEVGAVISEPHGNIWFTEPTERVIAKLSPSGVITRVKVSARPGGITLGSTGELWFTEPTTRKVGRVAQDGHVSEYPVPPSPVVPEHLGPGGRPALSEPPGPGATTAGPDGNLWFTNGAIVAGASGGQIDRITTGGLITEYDIPGAGSNPDQLVLGPDGNVWFTESTVNGGAIGRVSPDGSIATFALPEGHELGGIAAGHDGALWFTDVVFGQRRITGRIGRITPTGTMHFFALPTAEAQTGAIALGADGNMWFTAGTPHRTKSRSKNGRAVVRFAASIGRITPRGRVTEYPTRQLSLDIVSGPRGREMLFAPESSNVIARITLTGKVHEYAVSGRHSAL
jgi:streptogramin lyase